MLNTDQHKPTIMLKRMILQDFVHNCSKINENSDLPFDLLSYCFTSIQENEIKALKFRDMTYEQNILKIWWENYAKNRDLYKEMLNPQRFEKFSNFQNEESSIKVVDLYLNEIVCKGVVENIEFFVEKFGENLQEFVEFFENFIEFCIQSDFKQNLDLLLVY